MNDLIFLLDATDGCWGLLPLVKLAYNVIKILTIIIPIALIILGTLDLGKAVVASDDKEIKAAQSLLIKRLVYAAIIFFVPVLVTVVMNIVAKSATSDTTTTDVEGYKVDNDVNGDGWAKCWNNATS